MRIFVQNILIFVTETLKMTQRAEQIYFPVMIARNAGYGIAEKAVGIVLL